jgi:DnaJ like chaperone protein
MAKGEYSWLIGAGIGFALMGPLGAIVGGVIGSQIGKSKRGLGRSIPQDTEHPYERHTEHYTGGGTEGDLILSFLVLAAAITKADKKILSSEIKTLKEFLVRSFGTSRASVLMKMYREILEQPIDLDAVCGQIKQEADDRFKKTIVQILFEIALADDELAKSEVEVINKIAFKVGLTTAEYNAIASMYNQKAPDRDYDILEISPNASNDEIKSRYRDLVKKYHPDKVQHLGAEFKELADKKFKEINSAYERIREKKGL